MKKWKLENSEKEQLSLTEATALIYNLDLSINKYQELRLEILPKLHLPTRNEIDSHNSSLLPPEIKSDLNQTYCDSSNVILNTVNSLVNDSENPQLKELMSVHVEGKFGLDGSGSHSYRHQAGIYILP